MADIASQFLSVEEELSAQLACLQWPPNVSHVYNPVTYAAESHARYVRRYCPDASDEVVLFLGMNPGPFGMAQTGIPFGDVRSICEFLQIEATAVSRPASEHPKRPIKGFAIGRRDLSGERFWALASLLSGGDARAFFRRAFVHNYCPLCFLDARGCNLTPPKLPAACRRALEQMCDEALRRSVSLLNAPTVVAVGCYAAVRCRAALADTAVRVEMIAHPSPANPAANRSPGWPDTARAALQAAGLFVTEHA